MIGKRAARFIQYLTICVAALGDIGLAAAQDWPKPGESLKAALRVPGRDGDLKIVNRDGTVFELEISVGTTDLCLGNFEGTGRLQGNAIEFEPLDPQTPIARRCRIRVQADKSGIMVRESLCQGYHGWGCFYDGYYRPAR